MWSERTKAWSWYHARSCWAGMSLASVSSILCRHPSFRQSRSQTPQRWESSRSAERTKAVVLRAGSQYFSSDSEMKLHSVRSEYAESATVGVNVSGQGQGRCEG